MRRGLIVVLYLLGVVVVATALLAIIGGPPATPGGGPVPASIDSEYRFTSVMWLGVGVILFWSLRRPAERAVVTRVLLVVAGCGGIARLISLAVVGWPHPVFIAAGIVELVVVPLVIWRHSRVFPVRRRTPEVAG
jgi:hypothetical protein